MHVKALAKLASIVRQHDLPVLVTRTIQDAFTQPIEDVAGQRRPRMDNNPRWRILYAKHRLPSPYQPPGAPGRT